MGSCDNIAESSKFRNPEKSTTLSSHFLCVLLLPPFPSRATSTPHIILRNFDEEQNMSVNAVSAKCPFLARVPASFLGHAGPSLNMYGQRCPVMARMFHRAAPGGFNRAPLTKTLSLGESKRRGWRPMVCLLYMSMHCGLVAIHTISIWCWEDLALECRGLQGLLLLLVLKFPLSFLCLANIRHQSCRGSTAWKECNVGSPFLLL